MPSPEGQNLGPVGFLKQRTPGFWPENPKPKPTATLPHFLMNMNREHKDFPDQVNILVVDDEPSIRDLLKDGLERSGYVCETAGDGIEALEALERQTFDVVVTDIMMPRMDGIELSARVLKDHKANIIVMTGFIEEYSYDKVVEMGVSDFLEKPVGIRELSLRLNRVLRERANIQNREKAQAELRESLIKTRKVMESTVEAMALAIEARDPYTSGHQKRVAVLAEAVAREMGLPAYQIEGIRVAAMVHDVGKISIPGEILSKPGKLTELEMAMIKEHPQAGYDILKGIDFPWPVGEMVLQHHERTNGSGYPNGLEGKDIYLGAKILGVADMVEAMISHRPYRASLGTDSAMEEILKLRGVSLDAQTVDACVRLFKEKGFELH